MLTGRSPRDEIFNNGETNLQRWVEEVGIIPNMVIDILDQSLKELSFQINIVNHLILMLNLGLKCTTESPNERPQMKEVYATLKRTQSLLFM